MRARLPHEILGSPEDWPGDLVQRAVERIAERLVADMDSVATVAAANSWFQQ
jgi:DNA-binding transcriptional regulator PaaX